MCFAPWVSLSTAILEFAVATFILIRYKDYLVPAFSAIFIYVLGLYQFTEFMLCTGSNPHLWATIGFATYTFLPAIGVHMAIRFTKEKFNNYLWYVPPVIFGLIAFLKKDFVLSAGCDRVFVMVYALFIDSVNVVPYSLYLMYYSSFLFVAIFLFFLHMKKNQMGRIYFWWVSLFILTMTAPLILIVMLPNFNLQFPSIYCEFALLFSIAAVAGSEIYHRKKKKERLIE